MKRFHPLVSLAFLAAAWPAFLAVPASAAPFSDRPALVEAVAARADSGVFGGPMAEYFFRARRFAYVPDLGGDRWQKPEETEKRRAGDCEDKALWLYRQLKLAGYRDVSLVIGKFRSIDDHYHVWLQYRDAEGTDFLLDPSIQRRIWDLRRVRPGFYRPALIFSQDFPRGRRPGA